MRSEVQVERHPQSARGVQARAERSVHRRGNGVERFLQFVMRLADVRRVLEIGAFIGLSIMYFAQAVPADGEVASIEKFDKIARRNFELNGLSAVRRRRVPGHRPIAGRSIVRSRLHRRQ
jgi:predicted O-methyltransferase YrrM